MLHDQRRDLSLIAFRDFAAGKDPNETYKYSDRCNCACGLFARHIGLHDDWMDAPIGPHGGNVWAKMNAIAYGYPTGASYYDHMPAAHTWGALRQRIDAALATTVA